MIDHLILKQDTMDRKNLLMLGVKNKPVWQDGKDPADARFKSADGLPKVEKKMNSTEATRFDTKRFAASRQKSRLRMTSNDISHGLKETEEEDIGDGVASDAKLNPSLFKIDSDCYTCQGGTMDYKLKAFKLACLMYSQGSINYSNKEYHVEELLDVKAGVVAEC